jgi:hypothetical protein
VQTQTSGGRALVSGHTIRALAGEQGVSRKFVSRSVLFHAKEPGARLDQISKRRPMNVAIVAQANKAARTIWAILATGHTKKLREYKTSSTCAPRRRATIHRVIRRKVALAIVVMTKQVGPGIAKPECWQELRVRAESEMRVSGFHSGPRRHRLQQARI